MLLSGDVEMNPGSTHGDVLNKSVCILHQNIRSVSNKIQDIANIVDEFDILFITETHLDHSISVVDIIFPCFNITPFRLDRNIHAGGIILYYRENINISMRPDLQIDGTEVMRLEKNPK